MSRPYCFSQYDICMCSLHVGKKTYILYSTFTSNIGIHIHIVVTITILTNMVNRLISSSNQSPSRSNMNPLTSDTKGQRTNTIPRSRCSRLIKYYLDIPHIHSAYNNSTDGVGGNQTHTDLQQQNNDAQNMHHNQ